MYLFSADATILIKKLGALKTLKNRTQKLLIISPPFFSTAKWPKTSPNFNCSPCDLCIMTLITHLTIARFICTLRSDLEGTL